MGDFINKTDSNLYPEKVVSTYGSDGSKHTSFVYSLETWATLSLLDFLWILLLFVIIAPAVSSIFLIFYLLRITVTPLPNSHNFFGGLAALYLLIDYHNGWVFSRLIGAFFSNENQYLILDINLALLMLHAFLFFFGELLVEMAGKNWLLSVIYVLALGFVSYLVSKYMIDNHVVTFILRTD